MTRQQSERITFWAVGLALLLASSLYAKEKAPKQNADTARALVLLPPIRPIVALEAQENTPELERGAVKKLQSKGKLNLPVQNKDGEQANNWIETVLSSLNMQLLSFAAITSLGCTLCVMALALRRGRLRTSTVHSATETEQLPIPMITTQQEPSQVLAFDIVHRNRLSAVHQENELRKHSEEVALVLKFRQQGSAAALARHLGALRNDRESTKEALVARNLGTGRGEVALARHLQALQKTIEQTGVAQ